PSGKTFEGKLDSIDDFVVSLTESDGTHRSFRLDGDTPNVQIRDRLQAHRDLLRTYTDADIHDVTAFLVTLKCDGASFFTALRPPRCCSSPARLRSKL